MRKLIAVIGSSQASKEVLDTAFEVGREIITAGYSMICGGLRDRLCQKYDYCLFR
jgi:predicted Rossmann-fold nucleotide-binding protein